MADPSPSVTTIGIERSPLYREVHANAVNTRMNIYDIGITFGHVTNKEPGIAILNLIVEEVHVTMSYGQAKFLIDALGRSIEAYEQAFGPVPTQDLPPGFPDALKGTVAALRGNNLKRP